MELLDFTRKKTTQKVNLYEKVQIPGFHDAIRKIKRFLEDPVSYTHLDVYKRQMYPP